MNHQMKTRKIIHDSMNVYLISYDLGLPETREDYVRLIAFIKTFEYWAKPLQSVWLVKTSKGAAEIRDEIKPLVDSNDSVLVIEIKKHWSTYNISKEVTDWMKGKISD